MKSLEFCSRANQTSKVEGKRCFCNKKYIGWFWIIGVVFSNEKALRLPPLNTTLSICCWCGVSWPVKLCSYLKWQSSTAVFRRRGLSASLLCLVIVACRPAHPPINYWRPSFSDLRLISVGCGTLCPRRTPRRRLHWLFLRERLIDSSLQSFLHAISCSVRAVTLSVWTL